MGTKTIPSNVVQVNTPAPPVSFTWTHRTSPTANALFVCAYGGGVFMSCGFVGSTPCIFRSTDNGTTWSTVLLGALFSGVQITDACYANGRWIIVAGGGHGAYSLDGGVTWTALTSPFGVGAGSVGISYVNSTWLWLSNAAGNGNPATSPDGVNFTLQSYVQSGGFNVDTLVQDGSQFISLARPSGVTTFVTSPDGINWASHAVPPDIQGFSRIAAGNGLYMSANGSTPSIRIASTVAGLASASDTSLAGPLNPSTGVYTIAYGLTGASTPTFNAFGYDGEVASSTNNGVTWNTGTLNFIGVDGVRAMGAGNLTQVAVGDSGDISTYP